MNRLIALCFLLLCGATQAADSETPFELEPLTVTPTPNPLDNSINHLYSSLKESAPCLGCGALAAGQRESRVVSLIKYVFWTAEPPNPDLEQRRESRLQNEWRIQERGPEMDAFR